MCGGEAVQTDRDKEANTLKSSKEDGAGTVSKKRELTDQEKAVHEAWTSLWSDCDLDYVFTA